LLYLDGILGLRGWQWLFLIEGLPPILLGFITWFYLTERPTEAKWLETDERQWLANRIDTEHAIKQSPWGWSASLWLRCYSGLVSFYQLL